MSRHVALPLVPRLGGSAMGGLALLVAFAVNDPVQMLCRPIPLPPPVAARRLPTGKVVEVALPTPTPAKRK